MSEYGVFGNSPGCTVFSEGALLLLGPMNGGDERIRVLGMDRGGKFTCIYRDAGSLSTLRVKYVPHRFLRHPVVADRSCFVMELVDAEQHLACITARCSFWSSGWLGNVPPPSFGRRRNSLTAVGRGGRVFL